ncbi:MAG: class I SAM-dependent methyltransferase [bacterium]
MKILDVGCGDAKVKGAIGIDCAKLPDVDVVHDLSKYPWPFEDNSFDEIYMNNIIEHLPNTIKVMEEVHRILKKGGLLRIQVVYWNHMHSVSDPQHVTFFSEHSWDFFTGKRKGYYTNFKFDMVELNYIYDEYAKKFFRSEWLMKRLAYFLCNVKQGMNVILKKM